MREDFDALVYLLSTANLKTTHLKMLAWYDNATNKARFNNGAEFTLSFVKNNYILAHYTPADLSMLVGFDGLQRKLSIVNKSYVTLGYSTV